MIYHRPINDAWHGRNFAVASLHCDSMRETSMDDTVRQHKYLLTEDQMPTTWYNARAR